MGPKPKSNVCAEMKRGKVSFIFCFLLLFLITFGLLLWNIEGLINLYKGFTANRKRPPFRPHAVETTTLRQQEEDAFRLAKERWREQEEAFRRTSQFPTLPPSTLPPTTTTRRIKTTAPSWFYTTPSTTTTTEETTTTTEGTTTIRITTTDPTTTIFDEELWTSTRIHVTRPQPPLVPSTVPRIEVTRPHHEHRHHHHHHKHHSTTTPSTTTTSEGMDGPPEITIVTALIDIGRGDWWEYRRPLEKYHEFMENLLSLRNNMVIFVDSSSYDFVHKYRKNMGLMHKTKIHLVTIDDLPLSRHLPYAQKIIEDELKNDDMYRHDQSVRHHPEAKSAEYDVVVCSKSYFLYNATLEDPFNTDVFSWIDAGYGHGNQSVYPYDSVWKPIFPKGKVSLIKLTPEHDLIKGYSIKNLYRRNWSVVSGGFIGGDKRSLGQLHTIVHNKFIQLIYQNKVDDDQTLMVLAINSYPHLFSIRQGDWFDAFRLFSSDMETNFGR